MREALSVRALDNGWLIVDYGGYVQVQDGPPPGNVREQYTADELDALLSGTYTGPYKPVLREVLHYWNDYRRDFPTHREAAGDA